MNKKEKALEAVIILENLYPDALCSLQYKKPYELLIATRLSAQCTDERVNKVTQKLFKKYTSLESFANANYEELCMDVKPCGFFRTKARSIIDMSQKMINDFDSKVPDNMEDLLSLPGVGRKTANLILGDVYNKPAVVTDTHFIRITGRLGLTDKKDPAKVEKDLIPLLPPEKSSAFCHQIVLFGRDVCSARKPKCEICPMKSFCSYFENNKEN